MLEDELRQARAIIQKLKSETPNTGERDVDSLIQVLRGGPLPVPGASTPDDPVAKDRKVYNMMGGRGQLIRRSGTCEAFFGAASGFSFVCRTLGLFLKDFEAAPSTLNIHASMLELFDGDIPASWRLSAYQADQQDLHQQELPTRATRLRLLDSLFSRCSLVAQFLQESDLRQMMDRICESVSPHHEASSQRALMLTHSVLALGYLYHVPLHRTQGCRATVAKA